MGASYVSVRFYKLRPGTDPTEFERAFRELRPAVGLQKVFLLKGYRGDDVNLATSEHDYASVHIYATLEDAAKTVRLAEALQPDEELPEPLAKLVQFWRAAHSPEVSETSVNGFTLVSEVP